VKEERRGQKEGRSKRDRNELKNARYRRTMDENEKSVD
jgi:hypothetical protein